MGREIVVEPMLPEDWEQVRAIYEAGIATGNATFQKEVPSWDDWDAGHALECRIVAKRDGEIIGWAALSPVSSRCVYAGVAEVSVYVRPESKGQGVGSKLLEQLIEASEAHGFWTLQAGIFPENGSSIAIHKKNGFREVGRRERIGRMDGIWRDTVFLERRSNRIGLD
ncbi:N-acetyltransferase family protein [Halobacillus sp. ACCC02827]|nr:MULTISPECIES: GNAT family N-acetyltransferase [unclassified Halobacillus]WJE15336.1 N-acetyltransferase family protein [Halobacillus sp. ACCC02827]